MSQDLLQRLPKRTSLEDNITSKRRDHNPMNPNSQSRVFEISDAYQTYMLSDSCSKEPDRILCIGHRILLQSFENQEVWLGDDIFEVTPSIFFQL